MTLPAPFASAWSLVRDAFHDWSDDEAPRLGAALAYYTVFSLPPLLVVTVAIAGFAVGEEAARGRLVDDLGTLVGPEAGRSIQDMVATARRPGTGILATLLGAATLLLGASGVFGELKAALNRVWEVEPAPSGGLLGTIRARFFSITLVLGTGFLLLVSLVVSSILSRFSALLGGLMPGAALLGWIVDLAVSLGGITVMFALLFRFLPDAEVAWRDVWAGAAITAALFVVGKTALGLYLGTSDVASGFGAAGSLIVLLAWVYYSAQILLFGAEITQAWAARRGDRIRPAAGAKPTAGERPDASQAEHAYPRSDDRPTMH